jgi:hypothetical protein
LPAGLFVLPSSSPPAKLTQPLVFRQIAKLSQQYLFTFAAVNQIARVGLALKKLTTMNTITVRAHLTWSARDLRERVCADVGSALIGCRVN